MKSEVEAKIEYQKIIGEIKPGGFKPIRFSAIKYKASPTKHIDIRRFQRAENDDGEYIFYPTKMGFQFLEEDFRKVIKEYTLLPESYIHPDIAQKCFVLLQDKHFESAVLQAFKIIEIKIRDLINASPEEVGVRLIRKAFNADNGPLSNKSNPTSEREAFCNYLAGAFGYYKNPCSHRDVEIDFITAFQRVVVASDLLSEIESSINA